MASNTDDQLRLLIERIERLEEEKQGIGDDIKDVYGEARATGYDVKIMRQIVRLLELEAQGLSYAKIARTMGRAYTSIRMRLMHLALLADIPA